MFHTVFFYFDLLLCFVLLFLLRPVAVLFEYIIVFRVVIFALTCCCFYLSFVCLLNLCFCFIGIYYCLLSLCFCFDLLLFLLRYAIVLHMVIFVLNCYCFIGMCYCFIVFHMVILF